MAPGSWLEHARRGLGRFLHSPPAPALGLNKKAQWAKDRRISLLPSTLILFPCPNLDVPVTEGSLVQVSRYSQLLNRFSRLLSLRRFQIADKILLVACYSESVGKRTILMPISDFDSPGLLR